MAKHTHHHQTFGVIDPEGTQTDLNDNSIQLRAYQIHQEKGGSDIDNWLEAEINLKNNQIK